MLTTLPPHSPRHDFWGVWDLDNQRWIQHQLMSQADAEAYASAWQPCDGRRKYEARPYRADGGQEK